MITTETRQERTFLRVRAPSLSTWVEVLFRLRRDPGCRTARIQRALLEKEGADRCVRCQTPLTLDGYRATRTAYGSEKTLRCGGCQTEYIIDDDHIC